MTLNLAFYSIEKRLLHIYIFFSLKVELKPYILASLLRLYQLVMYYMRQSSTIYNHLEGG